MTVFGEITSELMEIFQQMEEKMFPSDEANPLKGQQPSRRQFSKGGFFRR